MNDRARQMRPRVGRSCLALAVTLLGCGGEDARQGRGPSASAVEIRSEAPVQAASTTAPSASVAQVGAPSPPPSGCKATRAFSALGGPELVTPPPSFGRTACEALRAVVPDYEADTESSPTVGAVRAGQGFAVEVAGRSVWALPYYVGKDAEESFLCGCCEAKANLALVAVASGAVEVVAKAAAPIPHAGLGTELEPSSLRLKLDDKRELVLLQSEFTCGTAPLRRVLHGFTLDGKKLTPVLEWFVGARGSTGVADVSEVSATVTNAERAGGPFDLVFTWTRSLCPFDDKAGEYVCGNGKPSGTELLRFDGSSYKLSGPRAKLEHLTIKN